MCLHFCLEEGSTWLQESLWGKTFFIVVNVLNVVTIHLHCQLLVLTAGFSIFLQNLNYYIRSFNWFCCARHKWIFPFSTFIHNLTTLIHQIAWFLHAVFSVHSVIMFDFNYAISFVYPRIVTIADILLTMTTNMLTFSWVERTAFYHCSIIASVYWQHQVTSGQHWLVWLEFIQCHCPKRSHPPVRV